MIEILGTGIGAGAAFLAWAARGRASRVFAPSVYCGPRARNSIALTFDDGPSEGTPLLVEELARRGVPATFFQCGSNVRRLPQVAREVSDAGHEIGNHSDTHTLLCFKSRAFLCAELERAQESVQTATGARPRYFRPPFGVRWFGLREAQRRAGLDGVMWSLIGLDWKLPAQQIAARVLSDTINGSIICLHDGRELSPRPDIGATIEAVRIVIPELLDRGFRFETVSGLLR